MCGKMKEIWQQMREENWEGTSEEYLHQHNEKELQKKRNNGELYFVLREENLLLQKIIFEGSYRECENYIDLNEDADKCRIIYDTDEDGNFSY